MRSKWGKIALTLIVIIAIQLCPSSIAANAIEEISTAATNIYARIYEYSGYAYIPDIRLTEALNAKISGWKSDNAIKISDLNKLTGEISSCYYGEKGISDLTGIQHCVNISTLQFEWNNISKVPDISSLTNLVKLNLSRNKISQVYGFSGLVNLKQLDLSVNNISNINSLSYLTNLTNLNISVNNVSFLYDLENLTELKGLYFNNNNISSLKGLEKMEKLTDINGSANNITTLETIKNSISLERVDFRDNQIGDITSIANMKNLKYLYLQNNCITDISALREHDTANIDVSNQLIKSTKYIGNGTITIKNPFRDTDGRILRPYYYSTGGRIVGDEIIWDGITGDKILSFRVESYVYNSRGYHYTYNATYQQNVTVNDNIAPKFINFEPSSNKLLPGETLKFYADVKDGETGVKSVYLLLEKNSVSSELEMIYDESIDKYVITIEYNEKDAYTKIKPICLTMRDNVNNRSIEWLNIGENAGKNVVTVHGSDGSLDLEAPVLKNISIGGKYVRPREKIYIYADAEDDKSGVKSVYIKYEALWSNGNKYTDISTRLFYNGQTGRYEAYIDEPSYLGCKFYKFNEIVLTDKSENSVTIDISDDEKIIEIRNEVPVINAENKQIKLLSEFDPLEGVTALDFEDGDMKELITYSGFVDTSKVGTYYITYTVVDRDNNKVNKTITVTVTNTAPVITLEDITINVGDDFNLYEGVTVTDNEEENLIDKLEIIQNGFNANEMGEYILTYKVADTAGEVCIKERKVLVDGVVPIVDEDLKKKIKRTLRIQDNEEITYSKIQKLKGIEYSFGEANSLVKSLEGLQYANKLEVIDLQYTALEDLTPLSKLISLKEISISRSNIEDLTPLQGLVNLERVHIYRSKFKNIDVVSKLINLEYLWVSENEIESIPDLSNLKKLKSIDLANNNITDFTNLRGFSGQIFANSSLKTDLGVINLGETYEFDIPILMCESLNTKHEIINYSSSDASCIINEKGKLEITPYRGGGSVDIKIVSTIEGLKGVSISNNIHLRINEAPSISASDIYLKAHEEFDPLSSVTAYDWEDGDISDDIFIEESTVDLDTAGEYKIVYKVIDSNGAFATEEIKVFVRSNEKPVISGAQDVIITQGSEFDLYDGVEVSDFEDGYITWKMDVNGSVDTNQCGTYKVTYEVSDWDGNITIVERNITVVPVGDFNKNGVIDENDLELMVHEYNKTPQSENWNAEFDINKDEIIDIYDYVLISSKLV